MGGVTRRRASSASIRTPRPSHRPWVKGKDHRKRQGGQLAQDGLDLVRSSMFSAGGRSIGRTVLLHVVTGRQVRRSSPTGAVRYRFHDRVPVRTTGDRRCPPRQIRHAHRRRRAAEVGQLVGDDRLCSSGIARSKLRRPASMWTSGISLALAANARPPRRWCHLVRRPLGAGGRRNGVEKRVASPIWCPGLGPHLEE